MDEPHQISTATSERISQAGDVLRRGRLTSLQSELVQVRFACTSSTATSETRKEWDDYRVQLTGLGDDKWYLKVF